MLNPNKPYYETQIWLKERVISKNEIIKKKFYKFFFDLGFNENQIFINNLTSFANKNSQTTKNELRIRNDKFIKVIKNNEEPKCILISGILLNSKNFYLIFSGYSFKGYYKSENSGNSIICLKKDNLNTFFKNSENNYFYQSKNVFSKDKKIKTKYFFLGISEEKISKEILENFIIQTKSFEFNPYEITAKKYDAPIPKSLDDLIYKIHDYRCAINYYSYEKCNSSIDWNEENKKAEKINRKTFQSHHFVPREYFKKNFETLDWSVIHNEINLIPLCYQCHKAIHSNNSEIMKKNFNSILEAYKKSNRYERFINYLVNDVGLSINDLYNFYSGKK